MIDFSFVLIWSKIIGFFPQSKPHEIGNILRGNILAISNEQAKVNAKCVHGGVFGSTRDESIVLNWEFLLIKFIDLTQIPSEDDGLTVAPLAFSFQYGDTVYNQVTISTNGYLCLGNNTDCFRSQRPIWTGANLVGLNYDLDTTRSGSGQIYYKTLSSNSSGFLQVQTIINIEDAAFIPTNMFMVKYDGVLPYDSDSNSTSSFVIYISTNSVKSFVTFVFTSCPKDLTSYGSSGLDYNNGGVLQQVVITNQCNASNVGITGTWVLPVLLFVPQTTVKPTTKPPPVICYVGCYADLVNSTNRDLSGLGLTGSNGIGGGSVESCVAYCYSQNFIYAGVQYG